jgi:hypothetical protein
MALCESSLSAHNGYGTKYWGWSGAKAPPTGQSRALVRAGDVVELPRRIVKVRDSGAHDAANAASLAIIVSGHDTVSASKSHRGLIVRVSAYSQIVQVVPQSGPSELTVSPQLLKRVS